MEGGGSSVGRKRALEGGGHRKEEEGTGRKRIPKGEGGTGRRTESYGGTYRDNRHGLWSQLTREFTKDGFVSQSVFSFKGSKHMLPLA